MLPVKETPQGMTFKVFIQPRSSKNNLAGLYADALKIKITAPPVDGAANKMCIQYLAKLLDVSNSRLEIVSGQSSRTKRILFRDEEGKAGRENMKNAIQSLLK